MYVTLQNEASTGNIQVVGGDNMVNLHNRHVLVVEDIIDTGRTMQKLLAILEQHHPKSIRVASLLVKRRPDSTGYRPDCECVHQCFSLIITKVQGLDSWMLMM